MITKLFINLEKKNPNVFSPLFVLANVKKKMHANLKNSNFSKNYHNEKILNLNDFTTDLSGNLSGLSENWTKFLHSYSPQLNLAAQNCIVNKFLQSLEENYSIKLSFNDLILSNLIELHESFSAFRKSLAKSGRCSICTKNFDGLKIHFLSCFNKYLKQFVENFDLQLISAQSELLNTSDLMPFHNLDDDDDEMMMMK